MKPDAALPGNGSIGAGTASCAATGKAMKQSRQDLLAPGHGVAQLRQGTGMYRMADIHPNEKKGDKGLVDNSHTKDFLLVDGILGVGAVRNGLALEALEGLMEDLLPVGRPRRKGGEVVIGATLALLLPPPGGQLRQVDDGRICVLELCHGDRR